MMKLKITQVAQIEDATQRVDADLSVHMDGLQERLAVLMKPSEKRLVMALRTKDTAAHKCVELL